MNTIIVQYHQICLSNEFKLELIICNLTIEYNMKVRKILQPF